MSSTWSEADDALVKAEYQKNTPLADIAQMLGRSVNSVRCRASRIKAERPDGEQIGFADPGPDSDDNAMTLDEMAQLPPEKNMIYTTAQDEECISDPIVYKGDMSPEDYERLQDAAALQPGEDFPPEYIPVEPAEEPAQEEQQPEPDSTPDKVVYHLTPESTAPLYGTCQFCGQINASINDPYIGQWSRDERATEVCTCQQSERAVRIKKQIADARERVDMLFGEGAEEYGFQPLKNEKSLDFLNDVVVLIANGVVRAATIQITGIKKAKISLSTKGTIKVERAETMKYQLEE